MDLIKIKTVYDDTCYIDREEYQRKIGQGRRLVKVYYSTGRVRTICRSYKKDPETMLLHVENIQDREQLLKGVVQTQDPELCASKGPEHETKRKEITLPITLCLGEMVPCGPPHKAVFPLKRRKSWPNVRFQKF